MKLNMLKLPGGKLEPADDYALEEMTKFKSNLVYEIEIKRPRNKKFHDKVFKFFRFVYTHWCEVNGVEDSKNQFDEFRSNLVINAGYYNTSFAIDGTLIVRAKSLSFEKMEQSEFEQLYNALIQAALNNQYIFSSMTDDNTINQLYSFFN